MNNYRVLFELLRFPWFLDVFRDPSVSVCPYAIKQGPGHRPRATRMPNAHAPSQDIPDPWGILEHWRPSGYVKTAIEHGTLLVFMAHL